MNLCALCVLCGKKGKMAIMAGNKSLGDAKNAKKDEFYTQQDLFDAGEEVLAAKNAEDAEREGESLRPLRSLRQKKPRHERRAYKIVITEVGYENGDMSFQVPQSYEARETRFWIDENGQKWRSLGNACWFTNLDVTKRHEEYVFVRKYKPEDYPKYDNLDAIDVGRRENIPEDWYGLMGVPDTFLAIYNPEQFELVGLGSGDLAKEIGVKKNFRGRTDIAYTVDGKPKCPYSRIIIRRKW